MKQNMSRQLLVIFTCKETTFGEPYVLACAASELNPGIVYTIPGFSSDAAQATYVPALRKDFIG